MNKEMISYEKISTYKPACDTRRKKLLKQQAQKNGMNISEYVCFLVEKDSNQKSHKQQIENALIENSILNSLLLNPELSNKSKQIIGKEIGKHV